MSFTISVGAFTQETGVTGQGAQIVFFFTTTLHCCIGEMLGCEDLWTTVIDSFT